MNSLYPADRAPIPSSTLTFLPLGAIEPKGWLRRQLQIQADGLSGHLDELWPDLGPKSGWLGGDGESWERGPYFLDGLVPLAYLLGDQRLIAKAKRWIDWTLENQAESGWLGPRRNTDWWPIGVMLKVLTQYQEVTHDPRVIPAMERFFGCMREELPSRPLESWASYRWADTALSVIWLYNRTGNSALLGNLRLLMQQGYDWSRHFSDFEFTAKTPSGFEHPTHVVNNAMGVKSPGLAFRITRDERHRMAALWAIDTLDRHHGQLNGVFTGDEHLAGKDPSQGTELCAVVELMFSLETLTNLFGSVKLADRLERIAFNALPATFSPDMWSHQYDQQVNQVLCTIARRQWTNNADDSNLFGLEPNYGCCTANMHQGWPKFASHLWMATPDNGLAAIAYAPCEVSARVGGGAAVRVAVETDYPFDETIRLRVETPLPVEFPLWLRIPAWAEGATVSVAGGEPEVACAGQFKIVAKEWTNGEVVELHLPMALRAVRGYRGSVAIERGPLVFSLKIGEEWKKVRGEEPTADYEVFPTAPWNYGLIVDPARVEDWMTVECKPVGDCPFSPEGAPLVISALGQRVSEWGLQENSAGPIPQNPAHSSEPMEEITLIPYGCTNLRVTEFPLIRGE